MAPLPCILADARKGGTDRGLTLEDIDTPGHVATVVCSHYALFLKLLVHPRQHCDVPREAEESRAKSQPQCLVPTLMTSLLAQPSPD